MTRLKRLSLVLLAATLLPAGAALARVDQPAQNAAPGTGSVVHLFGPQSVFNKIGNIVPEQNQAAPAADASTATPTSTSTAPVATNSATETPASSDTGSAGGLLHQMFVTGDGTPTSARLSQGRPGAR